MRINTKTNAFFYGCIAICFLLLLNGCQKDNKGNGKPVTVPSNSVLVINEGNLNWGNASIDLYDLKDSAYTSDVFKQANGRPLGDILQSVYVDSPNIYLVVNNSSKIEIVNSKDFKSSGSITGLTSPRYMYKYSSGKAYITDIYANSIHVVNLDERKVLTRIPCPGWTEELVGLGRDIYVTNFRTGMVYIIDGESDIISDSLYTGKGTSSILLDKDKKIWVMSAGETGIENARISQIDPITRKIIHQTELTSVISGLAIRLRINPAGDVLYFLKDGVYQIDLNTVSKDPALLVPANGQNFYGLDIRPDNGDIWISDAFDYTQRSRILVYSAQGQLKSSFKGGLISSAFSFLK